MSVGLITGIYGMRKTSEEKTVHQTKCFSVVILNSEEVTCAGLIQVQNEDQQQNLVADVSLRLWSLFVANGV